jgi:tetratricopeptide (TPR) repeat protein
MRFAGIMRFAGLCVLAAALPGIAADRPNAWIRLTTPHFELYTTAGEKRGREAILYFEQVRSFFTEAAPVRGVTEFPVRIIVFKNEKQYKPYTTNDVAFAYYTSSQTRDYIVMQDAEVEHFPAAIHEYMHLIVRHSGLTLPVWLNEGWADVYSTLKPMGKKTMVGDMIPGRLQPLFHEKWLDFDSLTSVKHDSPEYNERSRAGVFYAESWVFVHMLYLAPDYKPKFAAFVNAIVQGKTAAEACQIAYGRSAAQVFQDLQAYLRRNQLFGAVFSAKLSKSEEEAELSPVSEFESDLALADLLATIGKRDQAQAAYEGLAKQNPAQPEIPQSLGYLAWQHEDRESARQYFEKAFAAGDQDPQMCFHLAMLERGARQPDDKVIPPLLRALKLRPDYLDARLQLGEVELNAHNYEAALGAFLQIHNIVPDRAPELFNGMAYAYMQIGNLAEARKQAINARKWDRTEVDSRQTDDLIRYLDLRESAEKTPARAALPQAASLAPPASEIPALQRVRPPQPGDRNPFVQEGEKIERVEGVAKSLDCEGKGARFLVLVGQKVLTFDMPDPGLIQLKHNSDATFDFTCGPQKPFAVAIEYVPAATGAGGKATDTAGAIRKIEF